jgi:uncharacterized protein
MRRLFVTLALLLSVLAPAAATDFPGADARVIDGARLFDHVRLHALEDRLSELETRTSRQLVIVTLGSDTTANDYGAELRKHWGSAPDAKRVALIASPNEKRSVIQFDRSLLDVLPESVTDAVFRDTINPRFNSGDFTGGVSLAADSLIKVLNGEAAAAPQAPQRLAQNDITVPATAEFPALTGRVVDDAGILDAATREALRAKLAAFEQKTGIQIVVATVKSLNGNSIEDYANRLFRRWQLGQKGKNNGVLLLHAPTERKIRIEVGYGLEGTLTDAISKFIIANAIAPRFKVNDFAGGMTRGVDDIIKVLSGDEEIKQQGAPRQDWHIPWVVDQFWPFLVFGAIFIIAHAVLGGLRLIHALLIALGLAQRNPRKGFWHDVDNYSFATHSSGSGSSSSSWGSSSSGSSWSSSSDSGGFSGGGGDSGGGGASGDY